MWDKDPVSFIDDVVMKDGSQLIKDISTDMLNGLVDKMPVDTSRAVSNVSVSLDSPDYSVDEFRFIGRAGARSSGMSTINSIGDKEMPTVYLQDNLYYVQYLEKGHSGFAPSGVFLPTFLAVSMWYR